MKTNMILPLLFYTYLFAINVAAFFLYAGDKHRAVYDKRRIPEVLLLGLSIAGGAYGAGCAMMLFRHKTLHRAFIILVPVSLAVWSIFIVLLNYVL